MPRLQRALRGAGGADRAQQRRELTAAPSPLPIDVHVLRTGTHPSTIDVSFKSIAGMSDPSNSHERRPDLVMHQTESFTRTSHADGQADCGHRWADFYGRYRGPDPTVMRGFYDRRDGTQNAAYISLEFKCDHADAWTTSEPMTLVVWGDESRAQTRLQLRLHENKIRACARGGVLSSAAIDCDDWDYAADGLTDADICSNTWHQLGVQLWGGATNPATGGTQGQTISFDNVNRHHSPLGNDMYLAYVGSSDDFDFCMGGEHVLTFADGVVGGTYRGQIRKYRFEHLTENESMELVGPPRGRRELLWGSGGATAHGANVLLLTDTGLTWDWLGCALSFSWWTDAHTPGDPTDDEIWHHVRAVYEGEGTHRRKLYYDGVLVAAEDETQSGCADSYAARAIAHRKSADFVWGASPSAAIADVDATATQLTGELRDLQAWPTAHAPMPRPAIYTHARLEGFDSEGNQEATRRRIREEVWHARLPTNADPYTVTVEFTCDAGMHSIQDVALDDATNELSARWTLWRWGSSSTRELALYVEWQRQRFVHSWGASSRYTDYWDYSAGAGLGFRDLCDKRWHSVSVTYDGARKTLAFDGVERAYDSVAVRCERARVLRRLPARMAGADAAQAADDPRSPARARRLAQLRSKYGVSTAATPVAAPTAEADEVEGPGCTCRTTLNP